MNDSAHGGWTPLRVVRAAAVTVAAGVVALAYGGAAGAQPSGDQCSPAAMMRAHATAPIAGGVFPVADAVAKQMNAGARPFGTRNEAAIHAFADAVGALVQYPHDGSVGEPLQQEDQYQERETLDQILADWEAETPITEELRRQVQEEFDQAGLVDPQARGDRLAG